MYDVTVIGLGYVGLSIATLLSQKHRVTAYDISDEKVAKLKRNVSPIKDQEIQEFLDRGGLNLVATKDPMKALIGQDFYVIATPTDYNEESEKFDTRSIEAVLTEISQKNEHASVIIKSTIPIFYTQTIQKKYPNIEIIFSPEFLREGKALYDNLYPSRIIVSPVCDNARIFGEMLRECSIKQDVDLLVMDTTEAEAVKLFANTYLATRVSFFNELDTFADVHELDSRSIIQGISLDPRIGNYYNNPSFGYGGYCLPKDTKQLKANFKDIPSELINAVVEANTTRKKFIAEQIAKLNPHTVGIYKLAMKAGSDNFRSSSIRDVMRYLSESGAKLVIFDEQLKGHKEFEGYEIIEDFDEFINTSSVIVANRNYDELIPYANKVYTRDVFGDN